MPELTFTIQLTDEEYDVLTKVARRHARTKEDVIKEYLQDLVCNPPVTHGMDFLVREDDGTFRSVFVPDDVICKVRSMLTKDNLVGKINACTLLAEVTGEKCATKLVNMILNDYHTSLQRGDLFLADGTPVPDDVKYHTLQLLKDDAPAACKYLEDKMGTSIQQAYLLVKALQEGKLE